MKICWFSPPLTKTHRGWNRCHYWLCFPPSALGLLSTSSEIFDRSLHLPASVSSPTAARRVQSFGCGRQWRCPDLAPPSSLLPSSVLYSGPLPCCTLAPALPQRHRHSLLYKRMAHSLIILWSLLKNSLRLWINCVYSQDADFVDFVLYLLKDRQVVL